ncbi:MAG: hypothetical protein R3C58_04470 [Parvularculaceae bacterium]
MNKTAFRAGAVCAAFAAVSISALAAQTAPVRSPQPRTAPTVAPRETTIDLSKAGLKQATMNGWTAVTPDAATGDPALVPLRRPWLAARRGGKTWLGAMSASAPAIPSSWVQVAPDEEAVSCAPLEQPAAIVTKNALCIEKSAGVSMSVSEPGETTAGAYNYGISELNVAAPGAASVVTMLGRARKEFTSVPVGAGKSDVAGLYHYTLAAWDGAQGLYLRERRMVQHIVFGTGALEWITQHDSGWVKQTFALFGPLGCASQKPETICAAGDGVGDELSVFTTTVDYAIETAPAKLAFAATAPAMIGGGGHRKAGAALVWLDDASVLIAARGAVGNLQTTVYHAKTKSFAPWRIEGGAVAEGSTPACAVESGRAICVARSALDGKLYARTIAPR